MQEVYYSGTISDTSGSYEVAVTGLDEGTTYYFQAFMTVSDGNGGHTEIVSETSSFTTSSSTSTSRGYLNCFEVPAVSTSGNIVEGNEANDRGYKWYRFRTTNTNRAVATHTFQYNNRKIRNYTVMMDKSRQTAVWTAYAMHQTEWADNNTGRNDGWTLDPAFTFESGWQQEGASGTYNKGHLTASDERQTSKEMNKQTFYYSNQAPQNSSFNGGIWVQLENKVKAAAPTGRDTLYVVTGVLYEGTAQYSDGIQVPSHFYKCLMKCTFNSNGTMTDAKGCAYVLENRAYDNNSSSELPKYQVTIQSMEQRTGFDFFPNLPSNLQSAETTKSSLW